MKKRVLAMIMAGAMVFSCGCGSSGGGAAGSSDASSDPAPAASADVSADVAETPDIEGFYIATISDSNYVYRDDSEEELNMVATWEEFSLVNPSDPTASAEGSGAALALESYNASVKEKIDEFTDSYAEASGDAYMEDAYYTAEDKGDVVRFDDEVLSIRDYTYEFTLGAHGMYFFTGYNYDAATGEEIGLSDVIPDTDSLKEALAAALLEKYDSEYFYSGEDVATDLDVYFTDESVELNFTLGASGITFYFAPYDIAPYAVGALDVTLPYDSNVVNADYAPEDTDSYVLPVMPNAEMTIPSTGESMICYFEELDSESATYGGTVIIGENNNEIEFADGYGADAYIVHMGDKDFLAVNVAGSNDIESLYVYDLSDGKCTQIDTGDEGYGLCEFVHTDPSDFLMGTRSDMLSTFRAYGIYEFGEDGTYTRTSKWFYNADVYGEDSLPGTLTLKQDITAQVILEADSEDSDTRTIEAGTELTIFRTDNNSVVDLLTSDGTIVRLTVEDGEDCYQTVNGIDIEELFDGVVFAG
ncbi:MAG: DUF3298 and DUF4163 domain-containing protein [Eubacterium sp.]|nr:DUF3298 and DUF4163 domain-containing protein [Eubacterium sp.]